MNTSTVSLTAASLETFLLYARDAGNWSGNPWVSDGNITCTAAMRGNLSDLVQKGLIEIGGGTGWTDQRNNPGTTGRYIEFTPAGVQLAAQYGIEVN